MLKGSKISRYRILKLIDCYCLDLEASKTAVLLRLNRNTVNRYYGIFRRLVAQHQAIAGPHLQTTWHPEDTIYLEVRDKMCEAAVQDRLWPG
jgi:hypothetical protein